MTVTPYEHAKYDRPGVGQEIDHHEPILAQVHRQSEVVANSRACRNGSIAIRAVALRGHHSPSLGRGLAYFEVTLSPRAAWAAARRAIGTRNGLHET